MQPNYWQMILRIVEVDTRTQFQRKMDTHCQQQRKAAPMDTTPHYTRWGITLDVIMTEIMVTIAIITMVMVG